MRNTFKKPLSFILALSMVFATVFTLTLSALAATSTSMAGKVNIDNQSLNVRSGPATSYKVIHSLSKGSYVTLIRAC